MSICRRCHAEVVWVKSVRTDSNICLNPEPDLENGDILVVDGTGDPLSVTVAREARANGVKLFACHLATCERKNRKS